MLDICSIEKELKKRLQFPYKWGRIQNNFYDSKTNFIYKIQKFEALIEEIDLLFKNKNDYNSVRNYALNRWFNFWSAQGVESIFVACTAVKPASTRNDRLVDFEINKIKFDHKTSVFPKGYNHSIEEARNNPCDLIKWLYQNQSTQQRHHLKNRLFIVLFNSNFEHWKLKAELSFIKNKIESYVKNFDEKKLLKFSFEANSITLSDIIWIVK